MKRRKKKITKENIFFHIWFYNKKYENIIKIIKKFVYF